MKNKLLILVSGLLVGIVVGTVATSVISSYSESSTDKVEASMAEPEPLYWVAPMDANYRRDKPGKSPMGMDLVPVYKDGNDGNDQGAGTIRISPNVVNNLGVRTVEASFQTLASQINTVGYITYDEEKLVHIHPRVDGWIEKLYVKTVGDPVKKDQPLYDIYSPELVNAQEELLLAIERNNKRLIQAAENRLHALQLPQSAIDYVKSTKKVQQTITFYAPQNGVVENLKVREGFYVNPGATLMAIGDLSEVWVEAEVFERQAAQVKKGNMVTMTLDYIPGKTWQGKVDYVYPTLDIKTRTVKVRLRFDNQQGDFKPNMFAQIIIHAPDEQQALVIPKEALIRTGNQDRVVLALGEGRFKSIAVGVGRFDNTQVEILSGLNEGDEVVSSAQFLLDSESSKSSDFKRMNNDDDQEPMSMDMGSSGQGDDSSATKSSATTTGVINSMMPAHGMVNITRAAIEKWNRPAATIDFIASNKVDLNNFSVGDEVTFTFEIDDGEFVIIEMHSGADNNGNGQSEIN